MKQGLILSAATALLFATSPTFAQNVLINGDMETGQANSPFVANWLPNGVAGGTTNTYAQDSTQPHGGLFDAQFTGSSQGGGANAALFQITGPGTVSPGAYTLNFWAKTTFVGPSGVGFYQVLYFNAANGVVGNSGIQNITNSPAGYTLNTLNLTAPAGTDHVQVEFDAIVGAIDGSSTTINLDDVSLAPVPEPTSLALLAIGGGSLVARRRRRSH
ncbi:MAG: PEP-CTERM sorting domain-containing protein [Anaerolineae bacterium]|nr:PEP-CTERM sorting domain-containing protein [Phycisphaerae bacterium]